MQDIQQVAKSAAVEAGFELFGMVAYPFDEVAHFERWIDNGYAGDMRYLASRTVSGELKRSKVQNALRWARSVVVCGINYNPHAPYSIAGRDVHAGWISRYAMGRNTDYHTELFRRLRKIEETLQAQFGPMQSQCYVDTGPIVERALAQAAGIGWIGKNTCLINDREHLGSWLFLGALVTSYELSEEERSSLALPAADRCGSCTRCIEACPTGALLAPYQMDARKCIAYLTIEKRGSIDVELREPMGVNIFGCDICQDVCPWNRKAPITRVTGFTAHHDLVAPDLEWLASLSLEDWRALFRGSPVKRTRYQGFIRNVCVAMGNSGQRKFLPRLEELARSEDATIAEHAQWAIAEVVTASP